MMHVHVVITSHRIARWHKAAWLYYCWSNNVPCNRGMGYCGWALVDHQEVECSEAGAHTNTAAASQGADDHHNQECNDSLCKELIIMNQ